MDLVRLALAWWPMERELAYIRARAVGLLVRHVHTGRTYRVVGPAMVDGRPGLALRETETGQLEVHLAEFLEPA